MAVETQQLMQQLDDRAAAAGRAAAPRIAVVIPCYRERDHVLDVIARIPALVADIICVDDACPDRTGEFVASEARDPRVTVLYNARNEGVGGATKRGFVAALHAGADIVVKLDGDGQMDPDLIASLTAPIVAGHADYAKGNRFFSLENIAAMPRYRIIGNVVMSFVSKFSSGYWNIFDPANGFIGIHASALRLLPLDRISNDYFFESDMLFRLNTLRAVVMDVPMHARYGDEQSHLDVFASLPTFVGKHAGNFAKRIFYSYFLRNFSVASIQWILGPLLMLFGAGFGIYAWHAAESAGVAASAGTVMLAALPIIAGLQLVLAAIDFDVRSVPSVPLHRLLSKHLLNDHPGSVRIKEPGDPD